MSRDLSITISKDSGSLDVFLSVRDNEGYNNLGSRKLTPAEIEGVLQTIDAKLGTNLYPAMFQRLAATRTEKIERLQSLEDSAAKLREELEGA